MMVIYMDALWENGFLFCK